MNTKNGRIGRRGMNGGRSRKGAGSAIDALESRLLFSTYTVNTLSDSTSPGPGLLTLRQAVADANAHAGADAIVFSPGLFSSSLKTITLVHGQLSLTDTTGATTITGPGASKLAISGNSASRVFNINSKVNATISNLTITKGVGAIGPDGKYDGGGILNQGTLTLQESTVTGNTASPTTSASASYVSGRGGAIFSSGTLTIQSSTLSSNLAIGIGDTGAGVGFTGAGGAIFSTGPVTITGSTLTSNSAKGAATADIGSGGNATGGAIYATATVTLTNSTVSQNSAIGADMILGPSNGGSGSGGGIFSTVALTLNNSTVTGNTATGGTGAYGLNGGAYGGGIFAVGSLTLSLAVVSNNAATSGDDELASANSPAKGGGIFTSATTTMKWSTLSGNTARGGDGIYDGDAGSVAEGGGLFSTGTLTVSASSIFSNTAVGGVGSASMHSPPIHVGPGGSAQGGGVWCGQSATFTDTTIANNKAAGGAGGDASLGIPAKGDTGGAGGNANGGGVYANASVKLFDSTVSGNIVAAGAGGAGYSYTGGDFPPTAAGKPGTASGGGLTLITGSSLLDNTIVSANKAGSNFNDIAGTALSTSANNLIGVGGGLTNGVNGNKVGITNPKLSALGYNGGFTKTMLPLAGSAAINAGNNSLIPAGVTTDQRGDPRIVSQIVDIGADET